MLEVTPEQLQIVTNTLAEHLPGYEVRAFGSRVKGTAGRYSDLDLLVVTEIPLDFALLGSVRDAFSESDLPFRVDIVDSTGMTETLKAMLEDRFIVVQTA
jgi:type I restriction enzyme S subunit